jgi:hypothetical protein
MVNEGGKIQVLLASVVTPVKKEMAFTIFSKLILMIDDHHNPMD